MSLIADAEQAELTQNVASSKAPTSDVSPPSWTK